MVVFTFAKQTKILTYPPEVTLTLVSEGGVLLPDTKSVSSARIDLARVQPLSTVEASEALGASARVAVRDELADAAVCTRVEVAYVLKALGT